MIVKVGDVDLNLFLRLILDGQTPCKLPCVNCQIFLGIISISQVQQKERGAGVVASLGANIKTKVNTINTMTVSIRDNHNERLGRIEEEGGEEGGYEIRIITLKHNTRVTPSDTPEWGTMPADNKMQGANNLNIIPDLTEMT